MNRSLIFAAVGAALALTACGEPTSPAGRGKPPVPSKPEPPSLWSIQTQDEQGKVTKTVVVCADTAVRRSFSRPLPSPNGEPCKLLAPPIEQADRFAARCKTGGAHLDVQAARTGDPDRDFTIRLVIQSDVQGHETFAQTLHYRRQGDCPTGWNAGDTAAPGEIKVRNSVTGVSHVISSPAPSIAP